MSESSGAMEPELTHDHVWVAFEAGDERKEELGVVVVGPDTYRLVVPPLFVFGLAVGDEFRVDPETHRPEVVRHSGNLLVWLYPAGAAVVDTAAVVDEVEALGGTFEGGPDHGRILLFTIPVGATFPAIERIFDGFVAVHPSAEWLYANVYADDGVTPLRWWD
jgi:uncharacterized protein DUF4265